MCLSLLDLPLCVNLHGFPFTETIKAINLFSDKGDSFFDGLLYKHLYSVLCYSVMTMGSAPDTTCLSDLGGHSNRNISLVSGTQPCNRSTVRSMSYTPQATAAFAITITFMMILTIVGNFLVIIAVLTSRSLKGAQNLFLVSLAAADILVATLIIPFSLAYELQGYWAFSTLWCEIYRALDVLFCTSSIVHLCAIALDRYLSISRPVSYSIKRTPLRIKAAIVVVWLISAVISFPPLLTLDKSEGGEEVCKLNSERWYILYSTIGSFFAPCVIMILCEDLSDC